MMLKFKNDKERIAFLATMNEQPERKKGKWIDKSGGIEDAWNYCSICGEQAIDLYDFCPNCGADMRQPATHCTDDYCEREKKPQDGFTKWAKSVADSYRNDKEESE